MNHSYYYGLRSTLGGDKKRQAIEWLHVALCRLKLNCAASSLYRRTIGLFAKTSENRSLRKESVDRFADGTVLRATLIGLTSRAAGLAALKDGLGAR